jgi:hypothetical protein
VPFWRRRTGHDQAHPLDEFVGDGADRAAETIDLAVAARKWEQKVGAAAKRGPSALALPAFTILRGGDLFERTGKPKRSDPTLLDRYHDENLRLSHNKVAKAEREAAMQGILRVLAGNPAVLGRMAIAKPIRVELIPEGEDFRRYGFPRHTNPNAAGIFWNDERDETALIGLREEHITRRPHLMIHEMTHAVHLVGLTKRERDDIDQFLLPVYRSQRWVEEAVAIYAERAFGARYSDEDLGAPGLYGKTRRDWNAKHVFSLFMSEWLRP